MLLFGNEVKELLKKKPTISNSMAIVFLVLFIPMFLIVTTTYSLGVPLSPPCFALGFGLLIHQLYNLGKIIEKLEGE